MEKQWSRSVGGFRYRCDMGSQSWSCRLFRVGITTVVGVNGCYCFWLVTEAPSMCSCFVVIRARETSGTVWCEMLSIWHSTLEAPIMFHQNLPFFICQKGAVAFTFIISVKKSTPVLQLLGMLVLIWVVVSKTSRCHISTGCCWFLLLSYVVDCFSVLGSLFNKLWAISSICLFWPLNGLSTLAIAGTQSLNFKLDKCVHSASERQHTWDAKESVMLIVRVFFNPESFKQASVPLRRLFSVITHSAYAEKESFKGIFAFKMECTISYSQSGSRKRVQNSFMNKVKLSSAVRASQLFAIQLMIHWSLKESSILETWQSMGTFSLEKKVFTCHSCTTAGQRVPEKRTGAILLLSCPLTEAIVVELFIVWAMKTVNSEYAVETEDVEVSGEREAVGKWSEMWDDTGVAEPLECVKLTVLLHQLSGKVRNSAGLVLHVYVFDGCPVLEKEKEMNICMNICAWILDFIIGELSTNKTWIRLCKFKVKISWLLQKTIVTVKNKQAIAIKQSRAVKWLEVVKHLRVVKQLRAVNVRGPNGGFGKPDK